VETAAQLPHVPAVAVLDWTLHQKLTTPDELAAYAVAYMREWPGTIGLPDAVGQAHPKTESVGETRTRMWLEGARLQVQPQWEVFHPSGRLAGRVDFLVRDLGLMIEFDGQIKYGRLLKPGQSINDV